MVRQLSAAQRKYRSIFENATEGIFQTTLDGRLLEANLAMGLAAYLGDIPPFDRLFWQGPEFRDLSRAYAAQGGWTGLLNYVNVQTELELVGKAAEKVRIMTKRKNTSQGFSLIEIILLIVLSGILAVMILPYFFSGATSSNTPVERLETSAGLNKAMEAIISDYES